MTATSGPSYWFYARGDRACGPVDEAQLQEMVHAGRLSPKALVWRVGAPAWGAADKLLVTPTPIPWLRLGKLAILTLVPIAVAIAAFVKSDTLYDLEEPATVAALWASLVAVLAIGTGLVFAQWWRFAEALDHENRASVLPGVVKSAALVGGFMGAALFVFGVAGIDHLHRVATARAQYKDYRIVPDQTARALMIDGVIGPGFDTKLSAALEQSSLRRIYIDSIGGLLDEAMRAARTLERQQVEMIVTKACNSACLILFAAGKTRVAHINATFGFHAASPIVDGPEFFTDAVSAQGAESDAYLVSRGAPQSMIDEANRLGPVQVYQVAAAALADGGFVNRLFDGTDPSKALPQHVANWVSLEASLEDEHWPLAEMLRAIRESAPAVMSRDVPAWQAVPAGDQNVAAVQRAYALVSDLRRDALKAANDEAVGDYMRAHRQILQSLENTGAWDICASFAGDATATGAAPGSVRIDHARALARLVRSAAERNWIEVKIAPSTDKSFGTLKFEADLATMEGLVEGDDAEAHRACRHATIMATSLGRLGQTAAVDVFRYGELYGDFAP